MRKNKFRIFLFYFLLVVTAGFSSCSVAKGIFNAGMVWGIILVVGVIALIIFLIGKAGKNK